jgi:hypothetical protein
MKIFNVSLRVCITQIAELPDNPPEPPPEEKKPFDDDPVNKQEKMLSKYLDRVERMNAPRAPTAFPFPGYASEFTDGASMTRNIKISAETFEDLSAILKKFSDASKTLPEVPDSMLTVPMGSFGPMG